jgi:hypothetical protein
MPGTENPQETSGRPGRPMVFISYRRQDAEAADKLSELCEQAGLQPWMDRRDLQVGDNWREKIEQAIQSCEIFLLLISSPSEPGDATSPVEWSSICERRWSDPQVLVVPIRLDSAPLPPFVANSRYLNAPNDRALSKCVDKIRDVSSDEHLLTYFRRFHAVPREDSAARFKQLLEAVRKSATQTATKVDSDPQR